MLSNCFSYHVLPSIQLALLLFVFPFSFFSFFFLFYIYRYKYLWFFVSSCFLYLFVVVVSLFLSAVPSVRHICQTVSVSVYNVVLRLLKEELRGPAVPALTVQAFFIASKENPREKGRVLNAKLQQHFEKYHVLLSNVAKDVVQQMIVLAEVERDFRENGIKSEFVLLSFFWSVFVLQLCVVLVSGLFVALYFIVDLIFWLALSVKCCSRRQRPLDEDYGDTRKERRCIKGWI